MLRLLILFTSLFGVGLMAISQELIRNGGFERSLNPEIRQSGFDSLDAVEDWYNANQQRSGKFYGTPDHLYLTTNQQFNENRLSFTPYLGNGALGLITWMQRLPDYREIALTPLKSKTVPGKTYVLSFFVTRGAKKWFGSVGTTALQIHLSQEYVVQEGFEPLSTGQLIYTTDVVQHWTEWTKVEVLFKATADYQYLRIGSGKRDSELKILPYSYDLDPQEYLFFDEISLQLHEPLPTDPASPLVKRPVVVQDFFDCNSGKITLKYKDDKEEDGDRISIFLNDEQIVEEVRLRRKNKTVKLNLEPGEYTLSMFAHNLGIKPPNTALVSVNCGSKTKQIRLKSTLQQSGAVKLIVR